MSIKKVNRKRGWSKIELQWGRKRWQQLQLKQFSEIADAHEIKGRAAVNLRRYRFDTALSVIKQK